MGINYNKSEKGNTMTTITFDKNFKKALQLAAKVAPKHCRIPALECVNFELGTCQGHALISATNLEQYLSVQVKCVAEDVAVNKFALHRDKVKLLAKNVRETDSYCVTSNELESDSAKFAFDDSEKINPFALFSDKLLGSMVISDIETFRNSLEWVAPAASTDDARYILQGVYCDIQNDGNYFLVASDGKRIHVEKLCYNSSSIDKGFILPKQAVSFLIDVLALTKWESLEVCLFDNAVKFIASSDCLHIELITKLVNGSYPNYKAVLPSKRDAAVELQLNSESIAAIKRCHIKNQKMRLDIEPTTLSVATGKGGTIKKASAPAASNSNLLSSVIFVNGTYLVNALEGLQGATLKLLASRNQMPTDELLVVKSGNKLAVMMPVRP